MSISTLSLSCRLIVPCHDSCWLFPPPPSSCPLQCLGAPCLIPTADVISHFEHVVLSSCLVHSACHALSPPLPSCRVLFASTVCLVPCPAAATSWFEDVVQPVPAIVAGQLILCSRTTQTAMHVEHTIVCSTARRLNT